MSSDPSPSLCKSPVIPAAWGLGLLPVSLRFSLSPPGLSSDPQLCNDLELCDEAMALLDEVIMCTFQQSVYYLTKVGLLPCFLSDIISFPVGIMSDRSYVTSCLTL